MVDPNGLTWYSTSALEQYTGTTLQHRPATLFSKATASQVKRASGATILNDSMKRVKDQSLQDDTGSATAVLANPMVRHSTTSLLSPILATICMVVSVSLFMVATQRETPQRDVSSRPRR
jgi:hypothetical protein